MIKKKLIQSFTTILTISLLFGCASMPGVPGHISESISKFDNVKQLSMEPAWLYNSPIKLSLFKTTKMADSIVVIYATVKGAYNFSSNKSLQFNIDGKIYDFSSIDNLTDIITDSGIYNNVAYIPPSNWSSKRYIITKEFIKHLIDANKVWVKINLSQKFVEGKFSSDAPTTARPAFREFYRKILEW